MTATFGFVDPGQQAWMLLDDGRTAAYARAIERTVRTGDVVLDIGSGSGVLALLAARAGARRVYAVERTGMIELVRNHARENGFADVIVPVRKDFLDERIDALFTSPEDRPRVIIGEVMGALAVDEGQQHLYARARALSRDDAVTIPRATRLILAAARPVKLDEELDRVRALHGVTLDALVERLRARVSTFALTPNDLVGAERTLDTLPSADPLPRAFSASLVVERAGPVTGIVCAFEAELADDVVLSTSVYAPPTHWGQVFFPVHPPLDVPSGGTLDVVVRPRIVTDRGTWAWTVSHAGETRRGDAMRSLVGDLDDTAAQLGLKVADDGDRFVVSRTLRAWATALGAPLPADGVLDVDALAARVHAADPTGYPDESAARQEVRALLRAAGATRSEP